MPEMSQTVRPAPDAHAVAPKSLGARLVGVIVSPRATYADVAARPRVLGVLAVVVLLSAAAIYTFLSTEIGRQASLEQQVRTLESFGMTVNDTMYQRLQEGIGRGSIFAGIGQMVTLPLMAAVIAGIAIGVFNALLGGDASFKQVYAIVCHSGVIIALAQLFSLPLDYARETLSSPTNLAVFLPFLDEASFAARFLGVIDLFQIWWILSLSIGLGVLYKKRTAPIAWSIAGVYVVIALVIAAIKSAV